MRQPKIATDPAAAEPARAAQTAAISGRHLFNILRSPRPLRDVLRRLGRGQWQVHAATKPDTFPRNRRAQPLGVSVIVAAVIVAVRSSSAKNQAAGPEHLAALIGWLATSSPDHGPVEVQHDPQPKAL